MVVELRPGALVSGKLRLVRPLGQGGMGSVWLAEHLALEVEVAVKLIRPERAADPSFRTRFEREARAAARISSPHVVQIKDYGLIDEATPYIVMELLRGQSLHEALEREGRMGFAAVAALVADVAEALDAAHALGIVHRDIKPQNIFLAEGPAGPFISKEVVKVLDFGVAKVLGETQVPGHSGLTETGTVIGSPSYMSPEQLEGRRDVDHRADLWSLGVVAYQALTGSLPFEGGSFVRVGAAVLDGRYTPATAHRASLPASVDVWFARALALEAEGRFASARAMAEALRALEVEADDERARQPVGALGHATTERHAVETVVEERTITSASPAAAPEGAITETASSLAITPRPRPRRVAQAIALATLLLAGAVIVTREAPSETRPALALVPGECPAGMAFVAGGAFEMGSEPDDEVLKNETPLHREDVGAFCLDVTEVTVAAYEGCAACEPAPKTVQGEEITLGGQQFWSRFCNGGRGDRRDHPINCVSWDQADAYCAAQDKRLPTETEWELAARGADRRPYPWGHEPPSAARINGCGAGCSNLLTELRRELDKGAWPSMYPDSDGAADTAPVGRYPRGASPAGVLDLAGNVWEWTASAYCPYEQRDCRESRRVLRGGGWNSPDPKDVRVTRRHAGSPSERSHSIGFRCAWSRKVAVAPATGSL